MLPETLRTQPRETAPPDNKPFTAYLSDKVARAEIFK